MSLDDRRKLNFEREVQKAFLFLHDLGFVRTDSLPTLVRYRKDDVEVLVHHGRLSYEIGADISYLGKQYALAEIVRSQSPEVAKHCGSLMASTSEGVAMAIDELSTLMKHYGVEALKGDPEFFSKLDDKRKVWIEEYWVDGLARQVRPQAEEAFRLGDYAKAAELYARIRSRLSPTEIKKLKIAEGRGRR